MADVTIRDVDDEALRRLQERAGREGRTVEDVLRQLVAEAGRPSRADLLREMDEIRSRQPVRILDDSTDLIRRERDAR
jgi:plasmid stability protein